MSEFSAKLIAIFQNVNDWLKFAEAKNAALLAFSGTAMTAMLTVLVTAQYLPNALKIGLLIAVGLLNICTLLCAVSFLPKVNLEKLLWLGNKPYKKSNPTSTDNLYYFGDLKKYSSIELLDSLNKYYFNNLITSPYSKEVHDLAVQISINSNITSTKFYLFTYALYFLIGSIVCVPITIFVNLIMNRGL